MGPHKYAASSSLSETKMNLSECQLSETEGDHKYKCFEFILQASPSDPLELEKNA